MMLQDYLSKEESGTNVFLWIVQIFQVAFFIEHFIEYLRWNIFAKTNRL